jgi:undecaprenyl-diphosphatase
MNELDRAVFLWFNLGPDAASVWIDVARFATQLLPYGLVAAVVALALLGGRPGRQAAGCALLSMALAAGAARVLKPLFDTQRPFVQGLGARWLEHAADPSFPSSHATVVAALAVALLLSPGRWSIKLLMLAGALLVSWSRLALGLHFPFDVLGGWCLGGLAALAVWWAWRRMAARGKQLQNP